MPDGAASTVDASALPGAGGRRFRLRIGNPIRSSTLLTAMNDAMTDDANPTRSGPPFTPLMVLLALIGVVGLVVVAGEPKLGPGPGRQVISTELDAIPARSTDGSGPRGGAVRVPERESAGGAQPGVVTIPESREPKSERDPVLLQYSREDRRGEKPRAVQQVRVFGKVVDERGAPVVGALIVADGYAVADLGELPENIRATPAMEQYDETEIGRSDANGEFDLRVGFPLGFDRAAMADLEVEAVTRFARSEPGRVEWYHAAEETPLELVVPERGAVSGRLVADDGTVPENLVLRLRGTDAEQTWLGNAFVDEFGDFRFANLPAGPVSLSMESDLWRLEVSGSIEVAPLGEHALGTLTVVRRRVLDISLEGGGRDVYTHDFRVRFVRRDGSIEERTRSPYHGGLLRLVDPPADAIRIELVSAVFQSIHSPLPELSRQDRHELGPFTLVRSE